MCIRDRRYYCDQIEQAGGFIKPLGRLLPGEDTLSVLRPYGVWGVISPFNFPMALAAGMTGGALAAGNTVVLKPASEAALTGLRLHQILQEAGLPAGVCNIVTGSGSRLGRAFLEAGFDGLVFTGSKEVGMRLLSGFGRDYPRPVIVEMGGKNPAVVTASADIEKAAQGVARSAFGYGGQKCSACSRVYVEQSVYDKFVDALVDVTRSLKVGDPLLRDVYLGPLINERAEVDITQQRVADLERPCHVHQGIHELVVHRLLHVDPRAGAALLPTVTERRARDSLRGLLDVRARRHDGRVLAAHLDDDRPRIVPVSYTHLR